jgi:photosystem II stability/assembly factor-like uncharacterized protein
MNHGTRTWRLPWMAVLPVTVRAQAYSPSLLSGMQWRLLGPFRAGRTVAVAGVPTQPSVFYSGAVDGGVWKTDNAGITWDPIFDDAPIASIGAIAVAPSNPDIIYVGTGESDPRSQISYGDGMYRSTDAGKTWTHIGLDKSMHISHIIVDPANPNRLFVAVLGNLYAGNPERGIYRSTDGGSSWQKVLYKNRNIGAIDITFAPDNAQVIYAALWATRRPPWNVYPPANGPGSGVYKSTDGGTNWTHLTNGLPTAGLGKIGLAVAPTNSNRVYAILDANQGGLYRSDDAGATWKLADGEARIWGRGWYFDRVTVDPKNQDKLYLMNTSVYRSTDGGKSFDAIKGSAGGDDYHRLWVNPDDPDRMALSSDQGTIISVNGTRTWSDWHNQPTGQFYHVIADNRDPFWVYGAQQDSGPWGVVTDVPDGRITYRQWARPCTGGESDMFAMDPDSKADLYATTLLYDLNDNTLTRCNQITGVKKVVTPWQAYPGVAFRHTWTLPTVFSLAEGHALYFSNQFMFKSTDKGDHWQKISPDLTRAHPGVPSNLDPATAADTSYLQKTGDSHWGVIYAIAPSPLQADTVWAGTDDGLIWVTHDSGSHWQNVTPREVNAWSKVIMMDASHFDANTAYAAIDRHRLNDFTPHVLRTRDAGKTWQEVVKGLPSNAYVQAVREDPDRKGLLFAGTSIGVYVSFDAGNQWQSLRLNMPVVEIRDFAFHGNSVAIATFGRSLWILDDLNPLHQLDSAIAQSNIHLFKPAVAILRPGDDRPNRDTNLAVATNLTPLDVASGAPRMKGALLDYYLKSATNGPVTLDVLDAGGKVIRHYSSNTKYPVIDPKTMNVPAIWRSNPPPLLAAAGMHRFSWDLRAVAQGAHGFGGHRVLPGEYTVRLSVDGNSYTQPLTVQQHTATQQEVAALQARTQMVQQIIGLQTEVATAHNDLAQLRKQLEALQGPAAGKKGIAADIAEVEKQAREIEGHAPPPLPDTTGVGDAAPATSSLMGLAQILDGISRTTQQSSGAPTAGSAIGLNKVRQIVSATLAQLDQFKTKDVAQLNIKLRSAGLPEAKPLVDQGSTETKDAEGGH